MTALPLVVSDMSPTGTVNPQVLQEYLETVAEAAEGVPAPAGGEPRLLFGYAELRYRLGGGSHCAICRAHVRHVVPVLARRGSGQSLAYGCLCQRCLQGEIGLADEVELRIGGASVRYSRNPDEERATRPFVSPINVKPAGGSN